VNSSYSSLLTLLVEKLSGTHLLMSLDKLLKESSEFNFVMALQSKMDSSMILMQGKISSVKTTIKLLRQ